ncbi:hypothetical protein CAEBREN_14329 [Caenorhabditis brenneri]|uniref:Uncharacterized protein n=1 Tax=Caenorhabditis brenneri TaxID=135651 RepID=G0MK54_CAEBE|nr:hypothetical protein CAEBREN_14329 [Caenorhabditis brenneri]
MSQDQYILPPDSITMVVGVFAGLGFLITTIFVILAYIKAKSVVCKPADKEDVEKLNSIEGLRLIKDDMDELMESGKSGTAKKPRKKGKKDV